MLNPSGIEIAVAAAISLAMMAVLWKGLLNVAKVAKRGSERQPGIAAVFLVQAIAVLVAPGLVSSEVPPPIWTWPIWYASAGGFYLMALKFCWLDGIFPGLDIRGSK